MERRFKFEQKDELIKVLNKISNKEEFNHLKSDIKHIISVFNSDPDFSYYGINRLKYLLTKIELDWKKYETDSSEVIYLTHFADEIEELKLICDNSYILDLFLTSYSSNSENYYDKLIEEIQKKIDNLQGKLKDQQQTTKDNEENSELLSELEKAKAQNEQYQEEKQELLKKIDAQNNLKVKISNAFTELKNHISHIEKEKKRLNWMFGIYAFLSFLVFVILIIFELKYLSKWEKPTNWIDYLPFYIPVPIVGGLMWAFIYQMNRAQRQLMVVSYELYHVDYIEGLMQAINMISPNVALASEKISQVLDILIKKHISIPEGLFEKSLDKEISKDSIKMETVIDLMKKVKDVIK